MNTLRSTQVYEVRPRKDYRGVDLIFRCAAIRPGDDNLRETDDDHIASLLADISSHKVRVARLSARINWLFEFLLTQ